MIDFVQLADTVHTTTDSSGAGLNNPTYAYDDNVNTAQGGTFAGADGGQTATCSSIHTFTRPLRIQSIYFKCTGLGISAGQYSGSSSANCAVYYQVSGSSSWVSIATFAASQSGGGRSTSSVSMDKTATVSLDNVTAIKAYVSGSASSAGGSETYNGHAWLYEIRVFGDLGGGFIISI